MRALTNKKREALIGYSFVAPAMLGFAIVVLLPVVIILVLSLFKWDLVGEASFIGLDNFRKLMHSKSFANTLKVTGTYVLINIPPQLILAMLVALCLTKIRRGQKVLRAIILLPWIVTPIAISIVAKWMLNEKLGLVNYFLNVFGINSINFFNSKNALFTVSGVNIWQSVGFSALLFFIGMQSIPTDYYEAAVIDGVNGWQKFTKITLPLLKPTIMYQMITGIINSFQVFDTVYGMTGGGPGEVTNVYNYSVYMEGFQFLNTGYAAAMCTVLFFIMLAITAIQLRLFRDDD